MSTLSTLTRRMLECLGMTNLMILEMRPATCYMPNYKEMCQENLNREQQITTLK